MALKKVINSATQQFEPVLVDKLVLDAVPTVNSFNSVTSDAVARAVAGASGEVPAVTESDNGKVLKAVYDEGGAAVEWGEAAPAVTVDQTYNALSENPQSGTAVAEAIAAIPAPSVDEVPDVTSSDDGKVLTAAYSGGVGSYSWQTAQGGGGGASVEAGDGLVKSGDTLSVNMGNSLTLGTSTLDENNGSVNYFAYRGSYFFGQHLMQLDIKPRMFASGSLPEYASIYILNNVPGSETARGRYTGKVFTVSQDGADFVIDGFPGNLPFEFRADNVDMELGQITQFYGGLPAPIIYILFGFETNGSVQYFLYIQGRVKSDTKLVVAQPLPYYTSAFAGRVLQVQNDGTLAWVTLS